MIKKYFYRAFFKTNWKLAYRKIIAVNSSILNQDVKREYIPLKLSGDCWCADPFICSENNEIYVFTEYYLKDKKKGTIAAGKYSNGQLNDMKIVLEQDYHLSYPCIFKYDSAYYMIPETADNKSIELYKARQFPYDWELVRVFKKGISCVDTTVFIQNNEMYAIGYSFEGRKRKVCSFKLDMENKTLTELDKSEDDNNGRPAGNIFSFEGMLIRPTQVYRRKYGESIELRQIISLKQGDYREKVLSEIQATDIRVYGEKRVDRIHTINRIGNMEIIDYSVDKFDLFRPVKYVLKRLLH
jgi:hypothetical protein